MCLSNHMIKSTFISGLLLLSLGCDMLFESEKVPAAELVSVIPIVTDVSLPLVVIDTDTISSNTQRWTYSISDERIQRLLIGWTFDFVATYGVEQDSVVLRFKMAGSSEWVSIWHFFSNVGGWSTTDVWDYLDGPGIPPAHKLVEDHTIILEGRNLEGPPSLRVVRINPDVSSIPLPEKGVIRFAGTLEDGMIRLSDGYHWYRDGTVEEEVFTTGFYLQMTPDHIWWISGLDDTSQNMLVWFDRRTGVENRTPLSDNDWNHFTVLQNKLIGKPNLQRPTYPSDWAWVRYNLNDILAGKGLTSSLIDTLFMLTRDRPRGCIWSEDAILADIFLQSIRTPPIVAVLRPDLTLVRRREVPVSPYWLGLLDSDKYCAIATAELISEYVMRSNRYSGWLHKARPRIWLFPWK